MDAWKVWTAVRMHRNVVILSVVVAVVAAFTYSLSSPVVYVSTATLLPSERAIRTAVSGTEPASAAAAEVVPRETRMADLVVLAKSRTVAERVSRYVAVSPRSLARQIEVDRVTKPGDNTPTDLIRVTARLQDPSMTVEAANAWAVQFIAFYDEVTHREAVQARDFLEEEMGKAQRQLTYAAEDLDGFRRQHSVTDVPGEAASALTELAPLRSRRDELRARLAETTARLDSRRSQLSGLSSTRAVTAQETPLATIEALRKSIAESQADLIKLSQTYTDDYYRVRQLKQQIGAAQSELDRQLKRVDTVTKVVDDPSYASALADARTLEADARASQAGLERLESLIQSREAGLGKYAGLDLQFESRRRSYQEAQERARMISAQLHTARINERISNESGAIRLIDAARSAEGPVRPGPSPAQLLVSALLIGFLLGVAIAVAVDKVDTRIRTSEDASELMGLPVAGVIPHVPARLGSAPRTALVTHDAPTSPSAESYRFLATEVLLGAPPRGIKAIMMATARPGQGGTFTICNLAVTLAQAGRRVVLIDADLRRPSLHTLFGVANTFGLADILGSRRVGVTAASALRATSVGNLSLLTAGSDVANPWMLLRGTRMAEIMDELKQQSDYVLVDTPSAAAFADAAALASVVDGVMVVLRANQSPRGTELQVKDLLSRANANIMSVVLNDVPAESVDSYQFHSHYYRPVLGPESPGSVGGATIPHSLLQGSDPGSLPRKEGV